MDVWVFLKHQTGGEDGFPSSIIRHPVYLCQGHRKSQASRYSRNTGISLFIMHLLGINLPSFNASIHAPFCASVLKTPLKCSRQTSSASIVRIHNAQTPCYASMLMSHATIPSSRRLSQI